MTGDPLAPRLTPFELAFGDDRFQAGTFPDIRAEAAQRDVDVTHRERFLMLAAVGELLRELRPDDGDIQDAPEASLPRPDAVREYGMLLFQAYRFWETGKPVFTMAEPVLRAVVRASPLGDWRFTAPRSAGYLQLPRHLVWARIGKEAPPEAIDGFFWAVSGSAGDQPERIEILPVLGMHPGRPGFSVIEAAAELPAQPPQHWGDLAVRDDGPDFENILPGGKLRDLLAVTSASELLKLVSRIFHYIEQRPDALRPAPRGGENEADEAHALPPSSLDATAITDPERS